MDLKELADLGPSEEVITSANPTELAEALQKILNGSQSFPHYDIVRGGLGSIRLLLQKPFGESVSVPQGQAGILARELMQLTQENGARYPATSKNNQKKGWRIRKTVIEGMPAAIAEAAWA